MHRMLLKLWFAAIIIAVCMPVAGATDSFESRLREVDAVRSSDPARFAALLKELSADAPHATAPQIERFRYLQAYDLAAYQNRFADSIKQAGDLFEKTKDPVLKYRAGSLVANLAAINRNFSVGLRYLNATLPIRSQIKDKSIRQEGIGSAATLYNQIGQHKIGLQYAEEILADNPGPRQRCLAGWIQADAKRVLNLLPADDASLKSVVSQCESIKENIWSNLVVSVLARKWASEGRLDDAIKSLESSLPSVNATRYPRLIAEFRSILAELKLKVGDDKAAETHALATIALGKEVDSSPALVSAYFTLYQIAARHEKPTKALELYQHYAEADRAYQSDVKARELAYEIVRHETLQKNKEIELLQQTNQVLRLRQSLDRENAQKARLATIFLLILLAGIVFWAVQIKRHHRQLQKLAQTDSLTGLGNRHFFTQMSERSLVDAARAGEPAALVMFDLDHFKAINDTYGHGAGDWVLKQVGKTCSAHCRKIDYLGRIGGEEFAVLLRGIDLSGATRIAEDCRVQLAKIDTRECGYSFVVTGSFGVSSTAQSGYDLSRLLSHADQMLYRAKNEGRNRVCAYTADASIDHRSGKRAPTLSIVNS